MCLSDSDKGGPRRCAGHARKNLESRRDQLQEIADTRAAVTAEFDDLGAQADERLRQAGVDPDDIFAVLSGDTGTMTPAEIAEFQALRDRQNAVGYELDKHRDAFDEARRALAKARVGWYATPHGMGEAQLDLEAAQYANDPVLIGKVTSERAAGEKARNAEALTRQGRWGADDAGHLRACATGAPISRNDEAGSRAAAVGSLIRRDRIAAVSRASVTSDPDSRSTPDPSSGDMSSDWGVTRENVTLYRVNASGRQESVTLLHETSGPIRTDPTPPSSGAVLANALRRSEAYNPDYTEWAQANGFSATNRGWEGSRSYSLGQEAHARDKQDGERLRKFLGDSYDDYVTQALPRTHAAAG